MIEIMWIKCPQCKARLFICDEQDVRDKLAKHKCLATLLDRELTELLDQILERKE